MGQLRVFFAYELEDDGERKELFFSEKDLANFLHSERVLLLVREDLRRIFIWKGSRSSVKKRFISTRVASELQQELMKKNINRLYKIISVDQGDEPVEFLEEFNLESMEVEERLADMRFILETEKNKKKKEKNYPEEKEYRINKYIKLKLIRGQTIIFLDDKPFHQCKYLLLNLTKKDFKNFDHIESIDEAFEIYNKMDKKHEIEHDLLDPESEFLGHCSNLQAWYEHDYDLRILHSSLSIPLLKKMAFLGDKKALIRLKEEIATRIASGNYNTIIFYLNEQYFPLFTTEELEAMFEDWLEKKVNFAFMEKRRLWYPLLKELVERGITKAQKIIKKEIISFLKDDDAESYRYLLENHFFKLLALEDLEDIYEYVPRKDLVALRRLETLILKANLRKRRVSREDDDETEINTKN
jgi:hypothetical protein